MSKRGGTLQLIAAKSGLGAEKKVLRKAEEYERLLMMKPSSSYISDLAKSVFCLDLAANALGVDYDVKDLIKSSGLKPSQYSKYKRVVENMLEPSSAKLTVPLLCAQLDCDTVQEVANKVLKEVQKRSEIDIDPNLPQYVCMAVYQACRIKKIKVSKSKRSKFVVKSCLRPVQWSKMEAKWTKLVDTYFRSKKTKVANDLPKKMDIDNPVPKQDVEVDPPVEPYEVWKRRILTAAYAAIELEKQEAAAVEHEHETVSVLTTDTDSDSY